MVCSGTGNAGVLTNCPTAAADHPHVTTYGYDALGRNISSTDGRNKTKTRAFDAAGQVIKTTKPGGVVSSLSYDAMGRVIKTVQAAGSDVERTSRRLSISHRALAAVPSRLPIASSAPMPSDTVRSIRTAQPTDCSQPSLPEGRRGSTGTAAA